MTLRDEARACGAGFIEIRAEKAGKDRGWSRGRNHYDTPEELAGAFLRDEGYTDVLHYPYVRFPHGPTREYEPIYEICRAALLHSFLSILKIHFLTTPFSGTQNFFGMGNYHAQIETMAHSHSLVAPSDNFDAAKPLRELENAAQSYNTGDFRNDFVAYLESQLSHVRQCKKLDSVKREKNYDPQLMVNNLLRMREKQLSSMNPNIFDHFVHNLGQAGFTKILVGDLIPAEAHRSNFYDANELKVRSLYNKIVGWPDLTTVHNAEVHLFEVKTDDRLSKVQKAMIENLVENVGLAVSVIRIKPH